MAYVGYLPSSNADAGITESLTPTYTAGKLTSVQGALTDKTLTYDAEGRLSTVVDGYLGVTKTLGYDAEGVLISVVVT